MNPSAAAEQSQKGLTDSFASVAASLIAAKDLQAAFMSIVELGVSTVDGAEHAGITVYRRGRFDTPATTGPLPLLVNAIQYELGSGPCIDVVAGEPVSRSGDIGLDLRWPVFGVRASTETGVRSMMSMRLFLEGDGPTAGLNFYSTQPNAFDASTLIGGVFATHAALALAAAGRQERITNLEQALKSNRDIGVAIGIVMAQQSLTRQESFDLLRMASQHTHRKLHDIAVGVVETGVLDFPESDRAHGG